MFASFSLSNSNSNSRATTTQQQQQRRRRHYSRSIVIHWAPAFAAAAAAVAAASRFARSAAFGAHFLTFCLLSDAARHCFRWRPRAPQSGHSSGGNGGNGGRAAFKHAIEFARPADKSISRPGARSIASGSRVVLHPFQAKRLLSRLPSRLSTVGLKCLFDQQRGGGG